MNTKEMMVTIVTAIMVMTMFASSAMAITVDGLVSPSGEWDGDWSADDSTSGNPCDTENHGMGDWGYNMKTVYQHYDKDSNTLYFRLDVCGMPADLNGDGDVNGPCYPPHPPCDCEGVGAYEQYEIQLSSSGYPGVNIRYTDNFANSDSNAQWGADCIEFSLVNADTYVDTYDYCMFLSAGGIADPPYSEDLMDACYFDEPPVAEFDFTPTVCGGGMLDASASSDNVEIVKWEWDFCDDGIGDFDDAPNKSSVQYTCLGTCTVGLRVTDNLRQTDTIRHDVHVSGGPIVQVTTDADGCVDIGSMVEFSIDSLTNETPIASYQWTFDDGHTGSSDTSPTTSRTIPVHGVTATLTVTDTLGCIGVDHVSVCVKPPQEVPFLTPVGMVALIGMLCIVGAGRILTKGRRS